MDEKQIREKLAEGFLHVRAIVEVIGTPKEYTEESLKEHLKKIKSNYSIIKEIIEPPVKHEKFFSTFAELELLVKDSLALLSFCFDFMPSSIEILDPENISIKNSDLSGFLNDMQARLHAVNTGIVELKERNRLFIKNTAVLLRNFVVVLLSSRAMSIEKMQPYLGVKKDDLKKVLDVLIKEGKVKKEGSLYKAIPKK